VRPALTILLLLASVPGFSQSALAPMCVGLESSDTVAIATMSDSHQKVAGLAPHKAGNSLLKLWDTKTGKLIKSQTLVGYEPTGDGYAGLSFTAKGSYIYLTSLNIPTPGFWHLASNNILDTNCFTAGPGGMRHMEISNDEKIVYMTFDNHHALCDLNETAVTNILYLTSYDYGNAKYVDHLFDTFATKDDDAFFAGIRRMNLNAQSLSGKSSPYGHEKSELKALGDYLGGHLTNTEGQPVPEQAKQDSSEFLISGGYASDRQYSKNHDFSKYDQYLFFRPVGLTDGWWVFVLDWKVGEGHHIKLPSPFEHYIEHHWIPESQQLLIQLTHKEGKKHSLLAYHAKTRQLQTVHEVDEILAVASITNDEEKPVLHYVTKEDGNARYCRI